MGEKTTVEGLGELLASLTRPGVVVTLTVDEGRAHARLRVDRERGRAEVTLSGSKDMPQAQAMGELVTALEVLAVALQHTAETHGLPGFPESVPPEALQ